MSTTNAQLIERFYTSFAKGDIERMVACYADDIEFHDPVFGTLRGEDARDMWRMLSELGKGTLRITYANVTADENKGSATWIAEYTFSQTGRFVRNTVSASFEFRDGKIVRHTDQFSFFAWARQALGLPGLLFGWSRVMQRLLQRRSLALLRDYRAGSPHLS